MVELGTLLAVAVSLGLAYGVIYPRFEPKTMMKIWQADILITLGLVVVVGYSVGGVETRYSLIIFETNWLVFTILAMLVMEWPLFSAFCRRWGLKPFDPDQE